MSSYNQKRNAAAEPDGKNLKFFDAHNPPVGLRDSATHYLGLDESLSAQRRALKISVALQGPQKLSIGRQWAVIRYWVVSGCVVDEPHLTLYANLLIAFFYRFGALKVASIFAGAQIQSAPTSVAAKAQEKGVRFERLLSKQGKHFLHERVCFRTQIINLKIQHVDQGL